LKDTAQMLLIQHGHVIEALAPDTADEPLHVGILPRTVRRDLHFFDAQVPDALSEMVPVNAVSVA
jgi:hypothetical protein